MSFEAKFRGVCADCEDEVRPGTEVTYDRFGQLVHLVCPGRPDDVSMGDGKPCPDCFCYHAGECA